MLQFFAIIVHNVIRMFLVVDTYLPIRHYDVEPQI